jgi:hypothetical protein
MQVALIRGGMAGARAREVVRAVASLCVVVGTFLAAAWVAGTAPFGAEADPPYSETAVLRAVPFDAPLPYDIELVEAGEGDRLPYHTRWTSERTPGELAAQVRDHLSKSPKWQHTQVQALGGQFNSTFARVGSDGYMTHFAVLSVASEGGATVVTFDFSPIPTSLAP